jgi:hypothetical protein
MLFATTHQLQLTSRKPEVLCGAGEQSSQMLDGLCYVCYHSMKEFQPLRKRHKPERARSAMSIRHLSTPPETCMTIQSFCTDVENYVVGGLTPGGKDVSPRRSWFTACLGALNIKPPYNLQTLLSIQNKQVYKTLHDLYRDLFLKF